MKNQYLLLLILIFSIPILRAQVLSEEFESWPPENWVLEPEIDNGAWVQDNGNYPTSTGNAGPGSAYEGEFAAMYNNYEFIPEVSGSLTTPAFDLSSLETPIVQFYWWNNDAPLQPALIIIQTSVNGVDFVAIDTIEAKQSGDWVFYYHLLESDVSYVKIIGVSDYGLKNTYIDSFSISDVPDCLQPNSLSVLDTQPTSVTIDWVNGNSEVSWILEYGAVGFEHGTGTEVQVQSHPYTIENLTTNSNYEVYVKSDCGDESSPWTEALAFSTNCDIIGTLPWEEGFENDNIGCFQIQQFNPLETWYWTNNDAFIGPHSGEGYVRISYSTQPQDEWLISPVFDFSSIQPDQLSFWWALHYNFSVVEDNYDLKLKVSTDGEEWTSIWDETMAGVFENWVYQETNIDLSEFAGEPYFQFAFNYIGTDGAAAYIDEIFMDYNLGNTSLENSSSICLYPNPSRDFINIESKTPIKRISIYDMCGRFIDSQTVSGLRKFIWSTQELKLGSYILKIETDHSLFVEPLLIEK